MTSLGEYYRRRAREYDDVYLKPERQHDLAELKAMLPPMVAGRRVLEVAAGTGFWTQVLAPAAACITATDVNQETLDIASARDYGSAQVRLVAANAYELDAVPGEFDVVFCGFWWSHVARADIGRFLLAVATRVAPGATLMLLDNRYVPGSSQPIARTGRDGDTYQLRRLSDGRVYEVLKNFPDSTQLVADLTPWGSGVRLIELEYYWLACCELIAPA